MRAIITSCLAALAVTFTAGAASAQHGGGHGGGYGGPVYSGGHAPAYYSPPAHYSHGGYAAQPGGLGFGVYAGPAYGLPVGVYSGPVAVPAPYYPTYGFGSSYSHHRPHHPFHH